MTSPLLYYDLDNIIRTKVPHMTRYVGSLSTPLAIKINCFVEKDAMRNKIALKIFIWKI